MYVLEEAAREILLRTIYLIETVNVAGSVHLLTMTYRPAIRVDDELEKFAPSY